MQTLDRSSLRIQWIGICIDVVLWYRLATLVAAVRARIAAAADAALLTISVFVRVLLELVGQRCRLVVGFRVVG